MKVWDRTVIELATPGSAVRLASVARHVTDCAMRPSFSSLCEPCPYYGEKINIYCRIFLNKMICFFYLSHRGRGINNTLLLSCCRSRLLQPHGRVFVCKSSDLGSIPGQDSLEYFCSTTMMPSANNPSYDLSMHK